MAKKTLYYYLTANYGILIDGKRQTNLWTALCSSDSERNPSGIPSMGYIIKSARDFCQKEGYEFIEGSVSVISIIKLTKSQFDALNNTKEPADEAEG